MNFPSSPAPTYDYLNDWNVLPRTTCIASPSLDLETARRLIKTVATAAGRCLKGLAIIRNDTLPIDQQFKVSIPIANISKGAKDLFPSLHSVSLQDAILALNRRLFYQGEEELVQIKLQKEFDDAQTHVNDNTTIRWGKDLQRNCPDLEIHDVYQTHFAKNPYVKDVGLATTQGNRDQMEDAHLATVIQPIIQGEQLSIPLFGVFDGHSGKRCAQYLALELPGYLQKKMNTVFQNENVSDLEIFNILKHTFVDLGDEFIKKNKGRYTSGSTACVALIIKDHLWVANVGDSRAIFTADAQVVALSEDASLNLDKYINGVEKRGQFVQEDTRGELRVDRYNMARAVGHPEGTSGLNPRSKIIKYPLENLSKNSNHVIIACDGVWGVASSNQVAKKAQILINQRMNCNEIAFVITGKAFATGSNDNISTMVIELEAQKNEDDLMPLLDTLLIS